jgi:hypothetical protein
MDVSRAAPIHLPRVQPTVLGSAAEARPVAAAGRSRSRRRMVRVDRRRWLPPARLLEALTFEPSDPDHSPAQIGRRFARRFRIPLDSLTAASLRWVRERQGKHRCECGCGEVIRLLPRHYWHRAPRHVHGHQNRRGHWRSASAAGGRVPDHLGCGQGAWDWDHDPAAAGGHDVSPAGAHRRDQSLSRGGRRCASMPGHGTVKGRRREIACPRPALCPAVAGPSSDRCPDVVARSKLVANGIRTRV